MTTSMYIHPPIPVTSPVNASPAAIHCRDLVRVYTAQTSRREELELAHQALHALFVYSPHALVLLDDNGCVRLANQSFEQLAGVAATLVQGRMLHELLPQVALHSALERLRNDENAPNQLELMLRQPSARLFQVTIARLVAGPLRGWLIELQDQTGRQRLENQKIAFIDI
ncbi:MAG: PAS domain-containing protein, partial [Chloroflexaceae bacterium]|nr:PAS domain-containing protein [Chloroflexaceae bacterium]